MMRSLDALPAKTEANLESINGRTAEFFKTTVLYARRNLTPHLSFQTSVIYVREEGAAECQLYDPLVGQE